MDSSTQVSHFSERASILPCQPLLNLFLYYRRDILPGGGWETAKAAFEPFLQRWVPLPEMIFCHSPIGQRSWRVTVLKKALAQNCRPLPDGVLAEGDSTKSSSRSPLCTLPPPTEVHSELSGSLCTRDWKKPHSRPKFAVFPGRIWVYIKRPHEKTK